MKGMMVALMLVLALIIGFRGELAAQSAEPVIERTVAATFRVEPLLEGLGLPVAIAFLPGGRALIADRNSENLYLWDGRATTVTMVSGLPPIVTGEETGILDVVLHPEYQANGWIYLAYGDGVAERSTTAVDRFQLNGSRATDRQRLFTANAYGEDRLHYGGRVAIRDGYLYITVGDRHHEDRAQELSNHAGTIVRLHDDGRVPADNPFVGRDSALPEIWSYGHRNPQGLVFHPETGQLWSHEHGPLGGDELNLIQKGANYGWPEISYGWEYSGGPIGKGIVSQEGMQQPVWLWTPAISPSGMFFYRGNAFPGWRGSLILGSMGRRHINRLVLNEGRVILEERLIHRKWGRIRCVAEGPDGLIYFCTDDGRVLRLRPAE
jgi:glucose/arabinose dehydrogenase